MVSLVNRRFIAMLPLICGVPALCLAEEAPPPDSSEVAMSLGLTVAEGLVGGAASFVGGQIMSYYFSKPDSTPEAIENFIKSSLETLSKELMAEFRADLQKEVIASLSAEARAVQRSLALFASLDTKSQIRQRAILDRTLQDTSMGAERCLDFGVAALPAYAIFISQRIFAAEAFERLDQNKSITKAIARELQEAGREIYTRTNDYFIALDPDKRLGALQCSAESTASGGSFGVRTYACKFALDGADDPKNRYEDIAPQPAYDGLIETKAKDLLRRRYIELLVFRADQQSYLIEPLCRVADEWGKIEVRYLRR